MINSLPKNWPFVLIIIFFLIFFWRLFFPYISFLVPPDYGRSDAWHSSIANKYYYSQKLKENTFPLYNPSIGMGYPMFAEGQTGMLYLPNLLIFKFLPFAFAYNISLVGSFILASCGIYLFCRSINLKKGASLYAALIFPLGGFFMVHIQHINLIQSISLTPWLFFLINEFINKRKLIFLILFSLVESQQIFAGHIQTVFYSYFVLGIYSILKLKFEKKSLLNILPIAIFTTFGLLISSIQILPSIELLQNSVRTQEPKEVLNQFPYKAINLLQFLDPFILGSPKNATYPPWEPQKWSVYWEVIGYVGILPLVLAFSISIVNLFKKINYRNVVFIFSIILLISIPLALGKDSPLHPIFSFPPFSFFRVPSRFLIVTSFSLVILASLYLNKISTTKIIFFLIFISILDLGYKFWNYNPLVKANDWLNTPEVALFIKEQNIGNERIVTLLNYRAWNDVFLKQGWKNGSDYYEFARSALDENSNLIYDLNHLWVNSPLITKRFSAKLLMIHKSIKLQNNQIGLNDGLLASLASDGVKFLISPFDLKSNSVKKIFEERFEKYNINVYENQKYRNYFFVTDQINTAKNPSEVLDKYISKDFDPRSQAIVEQGFLKEDLDLKSWEALSADRKNQNFSFTIKTEGKGLLVINENFFPGWKAYVNGNENEIIPVNINQMAISIPEGNNFISINYEPLSLKIGILLSLVGLLLTLMTLRFILNIEYFIAKFTN